MVKQLAHHLRDSACSGRWVSTGASKRNSLKPVRASSATISPLNIGPGEQWPSRCDLGLATSGDRAGSRPQCRGRLLVLQRLAELWGWPTPCYALPRCSAKRALDSAFASSRILLRSSCSGAIRFEKVTPAPRGWKLGRCTAVSAVATDSASSLPKCPPVEMHGISLATVCTKACRSPVPSALAPWTSAGGDVTPGSGTPRVTEVPRGTSSRKSGIVAAEAAVGPTAATKGRAGRSRADGGDSGEASCAGPGPLTQPSDASDGDD